ncbi:outer membrane family protein [uncultured Helicobacter sp.]|uniref:outer membrane family protein n=1 Tax=uncultured Helicobacter sp. TaxID=175537 RepID=UPI00374EEE0E
MPQILEIAKRFTRLHTSVRIFTLAAALGGLWLRAEDHHHHHHHSDPVEFHAHIGLFGKSSALASSQSNARRDSYSMLYTTMLMKAQAFEAIDFGLGISAFVPFSMDTTFGGMRYEYIESKFTTNTAYIGYEKKFENLSLGIKAGRFEDEFDWVGHSLQGAYGYLQNPYFKLYGLWVDEQAHITREFATDFNFYRHLYDGKNLFAGGINLTLPFVEIAPFAYHMQEFFDVFGGKVIFSLGGVDSWHSTTLLHYAYLNSTFAHSSHHDHNHSHDDGHGHTIGERGDTFLIWVEQSVAYNNLIEFGAGYQKVGNHFFEIANMGSISRFEAHNHAHNGFGVIQPGGMHSGSQTTNMYEDRTNTIYGFVDIGFNKGAIEILGRDSRSARKTQSAYSLGVRYNVTLDLELGMIGVYMLEKLGQTDAINRSFGKAYVQYSF